MRPAGLALAGLVLTGPAAAQEASGWDLETADGRVAASVVFENGSGVVVQCAHSRLDVVLLGLPPTPARPRDLETRQLETGFDPEALDDDHWQSGPASTTAVSYGSAKRARSLRHGGVFIVRTDAETTDGPVRRFELPLPSDSSVLDQVLTACGKPLVEPRDDLADAGDLLVSPNWAPRPFMFSGSSSGKVTVSCIIAPRGRVEDCRVESEEPAGRGVGENLLRDAPNVRLNFGDNAELAVGRILHMTVTGPVIRRR